MIIRKLLLIASAGWLVLQSHAFELNWASEGWVGSTDAYQSQLLTDVDGSGVDVSVSVLVSGVGSLASPTNVNGAGNLILGVDYPTRDRANNFIDVTINFSSLVHWVSFDLNDVDKGGTNSNAYWEDVIENIAGFGTGGPLTAAATWGSGITPDSWSDPGETMYRGNSNNDWDDASRLSLAWSSPVSGITFRYSGGENTRSNPNFQVIGLSGINFYRYQAVPEPGTVLFGALASLALAGFALSRRRAHSQGKS